MKLAEFVTEFSYNQFVVFDSGIEVPGNEWTEDHSNQGFSKNASSVSFGTLLDFGYAHVQVFDRQYELNSEDSRVIEVPFYTESGTVHVEGPEENEPNAVSVEPGQYLLTAAQKANFDDETLFVCLHFKKAEPGIAKSRIIVQDDDLNPPVRLLE
ncbi:MAG: hypothetical protein IPM21_13900 [Acidobacteria bacterium]|nr:hypothetical protein [Acidobacteriota bacterium]